MPSHHLILGHNLLLLPSVFSSIRVFSNESTLRIRWPKFWSFSFGISPSNVYSGLISFRIDWFAVQGTLKSVLQHHSSETSVLWCSAFFMVQLSHLYMTPSSCNKYYKFSGLKLYTVILLKFWADVWKVLGETKMSAGLLPSGPSSSEGRTHILAFSNF